MYFEAERAEDFRVPGFSKDGKTQNPQIVLGLLVGPQGTPLAYEIFKGNPFEGGTMIPVLKAFAKRFRLSKPIVVADAGLMSKDNIAELERLGYQYILGARIKNMDQRASNFALSLRKVDGKSEEYSITATKRLVVHYSTKRAKKDSHNRERGLTKLEKDVASGRLTKEHLTNRGYKKFLSLKGETKIKVDRAKIKDPERWDGPKGYMTNTQLSKDEVMASYRELWQIERSFRITKSELAARPIYHRLEHRIRQILREETDDMSSFETLMASVPDGKWLELVVEEEGERCIDEKKLYRLLSNAKQSSGGMSNRKWWRKNVICGFYHFWCKPDQRVTKFLLYVQPDSSHIVLKARVKKGVGLSPQISVKQVESPDYPTSSEGYKSFINNTYKDFK